MGVGFIRLTREVQRRRICLRHYESCDRATLRIHRRMVPGAVYVTFVGTLLAGFATFFNLLLSD